MAFTVLATQRSGSNFVAELLRIHPSVDVLNEPFSQHLQIFRELEMEVWRASDYDRCYFHRALRNALETRQFLGELREWLTRENGYLLGIKETGLTEKLDWLGCAFPTKNYIILVRDPRAVVYSVLRRSLQNSWWQYRSRLKRYLEVHDDENIRNELHNLDSDVWVVAKVWQVRMRRLIDFAHRRNALIVRLEDLVESPVDITARMMEYLGASIHSSQERFLGESTTQSRGGTFSTMRRKDDVVSLWKRGLSQPDITIIAAVVSREAGELGYEI